MSGRASRRKNTRSDRKKVGERRLQMRKIKGLKDVVDWGLCTGCGACAYFCDKDAVAMQHIREIGVVARVDISRCGECRECLKFCPGYGVNSRGIKRDFPGGGSFDPLIGPYGKIWEGYAVDREIRYHASSGGILSALALYCIKEEGMNFVLHTAMAADSPWKNISVRSYNREDIIESTGSRYAPSSPCAQLELIENSDAPCVFIGRPCDTAAVLSMRSLRPKLDANIGLALTFFCAGPPCVQGTINLVKQIGINPDNVTSIRYRGNGWPGRFTVTCDNGSQKTLSYEESWGKLAKNHRSMRCHLCPDGLGECADVACGDAWHRKNEEENLGLSLVLARTNRGLELVDKARNAGYLNLAASKPSDVIAAQGLTGRRKIVHGRLSARKLFAIPGPRFTGFSLKLSWRRLSFKEKAKTVIGTCKRIITRRLWYPRSPF